MTDNVSIFTVPFSAEEKLLPTRKQLDEFLDRSKKEGGRERHADDCVLYRQLLKDVADREAMPDADTGSPDIGSRVRIAAIGFTGFASEALLSVVEQYKFQLQALTTIDYQNLAAFIKSAEKESSQLDAGKLKNALRLARLQEMVRERKALLDAAKSRWSELATELRRMAIYIRENLVKVEKQADTAAAVLKELEAADRKRQLVEDVKVHIKDRVKQSLRSGRITQTELDAAKKEYDTLAEVLFAHVEEDASALKDLFESICSHVKKSEIRIAVYLADMDGKKSAKDKQDCLKQIELVLITLIRDMQSQPKLTPDRPDYVHTAYMNEKRNEMLTFLFDEIRKDRRLRNDRRGSRDRRKSKSTTYKGKERRTGEDRRSERDRRR